MELPSGEASALVERLQFRDQVLEYVSENKYGLLEAELREQFDDPEEIYNVIRDLPINLGYIVRLCNQGCPNMVGPAIYICICRETILAKMEGVCWYF